MLRLKRKSGELPLATLLVNYSLLSFILSLPRGASGGVWTACAGGGTGVLAVCFFDNEGDDYA